MFMEEALADSPTFLKSVRGNPPCFPSCNDKFLLVYGFYSHRKDTVESLDISRGPASPPATGVPTES